MSTLLFFQICFDITFVYACLLPPLTVMLLFLGPLINSYIFQRSSIFSYFSLLFSNDECERLQTLRALVMAPIFEEFIFRGCIISVLIDSGWSRDTAMYISPLFFGVAHIHHFYQNVTVENQPVSMAMQISLFQFAYTTVTPHQFFLPPNDAL